MARPKSTGEIKSHQQHLLMTPTEVKAIDDWRFANRVSSRGEAIRRLCQNALILDSQLYEIIEVVDRALDFALEGHKKTLSQLRVVGWDKKGDEPEAVAVARAILERDMNWIGELVDGLQSLRLDVIELENRVASISEASNLRFGEREAREASRKIDQIRQRLADDEERSIENMRFHSAILKLTAEERAALDEMSDAEAEAYLNEKTAAEGDVKPRTFEDDNDDLDKILAVLKK